MAKPKRIKKVPTKPLVTRLPVQFIKRLNNARLQKNQTWEDFLIENLEPIVANIEEEMYEAHANAK
jgi:hypothetical protein